MMPLPKAAWRAVVRRAREIFEKESKRYWIGALLILAISSWAAPAIERAVDVGPIRYGLYQQMSELEWRPLLPRFVKVVLIGDKEHWGPELQGIVPIKRDYLARIVDKLAADNASVIALDFDVRLSDPQAKGTVSDIAPDTLPAVETLVHSIIAAAESGHRIVLSKTIAFAPNHDYELHADIYQPFGICTQPTADGRWKSPGRPPEFAISAKAARNIACGYIALPDDMRLLPLSAQTEDGKLLDSFAFAIAKQKNRKLAERISHKAYYGSYISQSVVDESDVILSAGALLSGNADAGEQVYGNPVIVGARWHVRARDEGDFVDLYETPAGTISGAVIHENFVEAILDSRAYGYVPDWALRVAEIVFCLIAIVAFALFGQVWAKLAVLVALFAALIVSQWLMLQIFGTFFDAFVPLFGLALHSIAERLLGHS